MAATSSWKINLVFFLCISLIIDTLAWDNEDFELFDVVEEVNRNFYELLGVGQEASSSEIRRAYRKLSLQLHPDKNDAVDAETQFRHLVAVYEVLKDSDKRKRYNEVLVNGLPNWRQPIYYYRRARKMGIVEMLIILSVILTIGQCLVKWAIYFEKRLTVDEFVNEQIERRKKKSRKKREDDEELNEMYRQNMIETLPRPKWGDLIPCVIVKTIVHRVRNLPETWDDLKSWIIDLIYSKKEEELDEEEEEEEDKEEEGTSTAIQ